MSRIPRIGPDLRQHFDVTHIRLVEAAAKCICRIVPIATAVLKTSAMFQAHKRWSDILV
jgi:hypothetical protein